MMMADRDKVIKGLKCIISGTVRCESCGYAIDKHGHHSCQQNCASDAIALLKEQEAVKPKLVGESMWICGKCEALLGWEDFTPSGVELIEYKFCPECGKKVKWE